MELNFIDFSCIYATKPLELFKFIPQKALDFEIMFTSSVENLVT